LILLGAWGALIPFIGPLFDFAFSPDRAWTWTTGRGWLEVLPGVVTVVGGLLLLASGNRATAMLGGWLAVAGGAWFVIGRALAGPLGIGDAGVPVAATEAKRVALELTYFYGLGALIVFLGAAALGRISVRSVRDVAWADRSTTAVARPAPATADRVDDRVDDEPAPVMADQRTEVIGPTAEAAQPRRRSWRNMFRGDDSHRGHRLAHR
jgi:hypothetical protein